MTIEQTLDYLKRSRDLLAVSYVKWTGNDGHGGHCALGAVVEICNMGGNYKYIQQILNSTAIALHPELYGQTLPRNEAGRRDHFNSTPTIFINNHLGKEAVLAVFDAAILDLELKLAGGTVPVERETEKTPVPVLA